MDKDLILVSSKEDIEHIKLYLSSNFDEEFLEQFKQFYIKKKDNYYSEIHGISSKKVLYRLL